MPDTFDANGLKVASLSELVTQLQDNLKQIYGSDINVEQNSPDGQAINIYAQGGADLRELLVQIVTSFDPNQARGAVLDQRVAINNIKRKGGTFTIQPIDITTDRTVALDGLDADFSNIDGEGYTVQDDAGNEFILIDSVTLTAGTTARNFRARQLGKVETTVGTITNQKTVVLGVTDINNSSGPSETGQNEETDESLRLRRARSVAIASNGFLDGIDGALLDLEGVVDVAVFENVTNTTDADGIPAHGIWVIVEGGANTDIADVIFNKKSAGADMKGSVTVDKTTPSGQTFTAKFDRPSAKDLYIEFDIQKFPRFTGTFPQSLIKQQIVDTLSYNIGEAADTAAITQIIFQAIQDQTGTKTGTPVNVQISSDNVNFFEYLETDAKDEQWVVDTSRISITVL